MSLDKPLEESMDLTRTDELFNSSIKRAGSNEEGKYTEEDIKKQRVVIGFGNLHIKTAQTKISAIRLTGYRDNIKQLKNNVVRKYRNARKYPK